MNTTTTDIPAGFKAQQVFTYDFTLIEYSEQITSTLTIHHSDKTGEFFVASIDMHDGSFADWGWFERSCRGSLADIAQQVEDFKARHIEAKAAYDD